jgi:hypothetical protein
VDAVGQLDQDDADILHHGQQHLAEAFRLAVLGREEIQLGQLGDAIDAARHFLAELLAHLLDGDAGILHHVVQQAGLHGDHVHAHFGQDAGHADGVRHVRLAGVAHLPFMPLPGEAEGLFQPREIVLGPVRANLGFQLAVRLLHRIGGTRERQRFRNAGGLGGHCTSIVACPMPLSFRGTEPPARIVGQDYILRAGFQPALVGLCTGGSGRVTNLPHNFPRIPVPGKTKWH